jgi:hypothetical protein
MKPLSDKLQFVAAGKKRNSQPETFDKPEFVGHYIEEQNECPIQRLSKK